ncbi:MAG TPA: MipA/OmpV family protein [Burkholderiales bacterium]|nr:MipA/OmpV family protein [Burkholderiales bacterium]
MSKIRALAVLLALVTTPAAATSDPLVGLLEGAGSAGLGAAVRIEPSMYKDAGVRYDLLPLLLYESTYLYLHGYRMGLKLYDTPEQLVDVFVSHRFEGFPYDKLPASLEGMAGRDTGTDFGLSFERRGAWGAAFVELLHDVSGASSGSEARVGYFYERRRGPWRLRPYATISWRDATLNNYYYGLLPGEATATRPAYAPGSGVNLDFGVYADYHLSERWRLLGGISVTQWSQGVADSPIVSGGTQLKALAGFAYDFSPEKGAWKEMGRPLDVKLMYGKSTDCNLLPVMALQCTSTSTVDNTRIAGIELGRPFLERMHGWPVDIVGNAGAIYHDENGLQQNSWAVHADMKAFYYGFPWDEHVRTRLGFGFGLSYAFRVPYVEARDQAARGRPASKLLVYLDPTIDISVGDLFGSRKLHDTYVGLGASHRSGIFGSSQLLGNVNGGSNYIYTYVQWRM